jgi:hypothetical protein
LKAVVCFNHLSYPELKDEFRAPTVDDPWVVEASAEIDNLSGLARIMADFRLEWPVPFEENSTSRPV